MLAFAPRELCTGSTISLGKAGALAFAPRQLCAGSTTSLGKAGAEGKDGTTGPVRMVFFAAPALSPLGNPKPALNSAGIPLAVIVARLSGALKPECPIAI